MSDISRKFHEISFHPFCAILPTSSDPEKKILYPAYKGLNATSPKYLRVFVRHNRPILIHTWTKRLLHPHVRQWNRYGRNFCDYSGLRLTWNAPVTAPHRNPTLPCRTSMPSGIVEDQRCSLGGHSPKSALALCQVQINNCISFTFPSDCSNNAVSNTYRY